MKHIQLFEEFIESILAESAGVPSNIMEFAKRKGYYATELVKKAAEWAEKAGKNISGGSIAGKNQSYMIFLDMNRKGSEIYIDLDTETIELHGVKVTDAKSFKKVFDLHESVSIHEGNTVTFTLDDGDLDDKFLSDKSLSRNLDYKEDGKDTYYVLPKRDFDRLQDWADSSGYDTDEVIDVIEESKVTEDSKKVWKQGTDLYVDSDFVNKFLA